MAFAQDKIDWEDFSLKFYKELNIARTNPALYATYLEEYLDKFSEDGSLIISNKLGKVTLLSTQEGKDAFIEAIEYLKNQEPIGTLKYSKQISKAAREHAQEQKKNNTYGHGSANGEGPLDRVSKYGYPIGYVGEVLMYAPGIDPRQMVILLIVDDNVPDRGHRISIFSEDYLVAGSACGEHPSYGRMCGANFAEGFLDYEDLLIENLLDTTLYQVPDSLLNEGRKYRVIIDLDSVGGIEKVHKTVKQK